MQFIMSKGSLFWGNASGKLGESVFYRAGGEQRNRTYVKKIKNPRTQAQAIVRATMNNLVQTYKNGKAIYANSFPTRKNNQTAFNAYMQANKNAMSAVVTPYGASQGLSVPYGVYVSKGDDTILGQMQTLLDAGNDARFFGWQVSDELGVPPAWVSAILGDSKNKTLTAENMPSVLSGLGLPSTAKITCVRYTYEDEGFEFGASVYSAEGIKHIGSASRTPIRLNLYNLAADNTPEIDALGLMGDQDPAGDAEELLAVFVSYRNADGKQIVSTAQLQPSASGLGFIKQFLPDGEIYEQIVNSLTAEQPII